MRVTLATWQLFAAVALYLESERRPGWVAAADAHFVVDSRARTPSGPAVVPFGDRALVLALAGLLVVTVGGDIAIFAALDIGLLTDSSLGASLAVLPASAYRGRVFGKVLYVAVPGRSSFVSGWLATRSLLLWWVAILFGTTLAVKTR